MFRWVGWICAALVTIAMLSTPASAEREDAVPAGFVPSSTSWISDSNGFVLGYAPCAAGQCARLVRTTDGGATWRPLSAPAVPLVSVDRRPRVHFANTRDGVITDGQGMWVTYTGGLRWLRVEVNGGPAFEIGALASNNRAFYAVVINDTRTRLFALPRGGTRLAAVPGVELAGRGGGTIAAQGDRAYVALNVIHESIRYWTGARAWQPAEPPCTIDGNPELSLTGGTVFALCSSNPGQGFMAKDLMRSDGGPFQFVSQAPDPGITTDFAAASPSTVAIAAIGGGAAWLHRCTREATVWDTPFITDELPFADLAFTSANNGVVLWGGPLWGDAKLYRTHDAGAGWTALSMAGA